jgi:hypothetical protein
MTYYYISEEYPEGIKLLCNFGRYRPDCTVSHFRNNVTFTVDAVRKSNPRFVERELCSAQIHWSGCKRGKAALSYTCHAVIQEEWRCNQLIHNLSRCTGQHYALAALPPGKEFPVGIWCAPTLGYDNDSRIKGQFGRIQTRSSKCTGVLISP